MLITGNSRISHHTITLTGITFSIPPSENFTDGSWDRRGIELCKSEIGVNEADKRVFMRINDEIVEFASMSDLLEVIDKYDGIISEIDTKLNKCCEKVNGDIKVINENIKKLETQLVKCCRRSGKDVISNVTYIPIYIPSKGVYDIISVKSSEPSYVKQDTIYNYKSMEVRRQANKVVKPNSIKNKNYYSDSQIQGLRTNISIVNKNYGKDYMISKNGEKYFI